MKIAIAGGTGFLGRTLARHFAGGNFEIVILTRSPGSAAGLVREVFWDGRTIGAWAAELEGATAVMNLAGRSVNCRYHARNRREILDSRLEPTRVLGEAIARCENSPRVWMNASTATIYKHSLDHAMDEQGEIGATPAAQDAFSVEVARAWERIFADAATPRTRQVVLRTAMVLGNAPNSVFPALRRLARFGLGGAMAGGGQYASWIHEHDFCRAIEWLAAHDNFSGVVNVAAPNPLPNREMMGIFRRVCGMPIGLPATNWMLEIGAVLLRTETELIIKSRRVVPGRLLAAGFRFEFPEMESAVRDLEDRIPGSRADRLNPEAGHVCCFSGIRDGQHR